MAQSLEAAADARVDAHRAGLEDEAADQVGVDAARRLDLPAGGLLDLLDDRASLVGRELEGGRQLDVEDALLARHRFSNSRCISAISCARPFSTTSSRKLRTSSSVPPSRSSSSADLGARVELRVPEDRVELGHVFERLDEVVELVADGLERALLLGGLEERLRVDALRDGHQFLSVLEHGEVEVADSASSIRRRWSSSVEHLAGHLAGRDERQVGDLRADLLERAARLGLDLAARLLEAALALGLELVAQALALRVGDAARLGEDLLRVAARLADQRAVLVEQLARLVAGVVGLVDRLADPLAPLVDGLLDGPERVPLEARRT